MPETDFSKLATDCLAKIETWLEDFDPDELDFSGGDGVVTLEFADGTRFVVNRQGAAGQIWFAAGARAWHYNYNAETSRWKGDKDGHDLFERMAEVVGEKLGSDVSFEA